ncbi:MAG: hypothetical protein HY226_04670 [Candidatus Vogelbacteria bacterium]|nr:hypothetical protein [Candidatus Vogelbacteria bacterium]
MSCVGLRTGVENLLRSVPGFCSVFLQRPFGYQSKSTTPPKSLRAKLQYQGSQDYNQHPTQVILKAVPPIGRLACATEKDNKVGMEKWLDKIARNRAARELADKTVKTEREEKAEAIKTIQVRLERFISTPEYAAATALVRDLNKRLKLYCNGHELQKLRFSNGIEGFKLSEADWGNWNKGDNIQTLAHYVSESMNCLNTRDADQKFDSMVTTLFAELEKLSE